MMGVRGIAPALAMVTGVRGIRAPALAMVVGVWGWRAPALVMVVGVRGSRAPALSIFVSSTVRPIPSRGADSCLK